MSSPAPELHPVPVDLAAYRASLPDGARESAGLEDAAWLLAGALAASPCASRLPGGVVVVREGPDPALGLLARVPEAEREWLAAAVGALEGSVDRLRWVGWPEAEAAAEEAAEALRRRIGPEGLTGAAVRAVPRGGMVAAGLLSYALDLPAAALERDPASAPLTLVVDDCALTGARFREVRERLSDGPVVFAPLFSTPQLREALEADGLAEACVGGRDLVDHAPRRLGDEYAAWARRWRERGRGRVPWVGQPDHLVFPWCEPEVAVWDGEREEEAPGFGVAPPELCLARRGRADEGWEVRPQPRGPGPLRAAPGLLWGRMDDAVVIRDPDGARALTLRGTAAEMWEAVVAEGRAEPAARRVAAAYEVPVDRVAADLRELADGLRERGALVGRETARASAGAGDHARTGGR